MSGGAAADVLIVGGGVIGCAIAHNLAKQGARVTIVERRRLGQEASWASAGIVAPPGSPPTPAGRGARILEETPVLGLLAAGARVAGVHTAGGDLHAEQVLLAAGAWTAQLGALAGVALPTRPVRGQMLAVAGPDDGPPLQPIIAGA